MNASAQRVNVNCWRKREKDEVDFTKYGWMGFEKDTNPIQPIF